MGIFPGVGNRWVGGAANSSKAMSKAASKSATERPSDCKTSGFDFMSILTGLIRLQSTWLKHKLLPVPARCQGVVVHRAIHFDRSPFLFWLGLGGNECDSQLYLFRPLVRRFARPIGRDLTNPQTGIDLSGPLDDPYEENRSHHQALQTGGSERRARSRSASRA